MKALITKENINSNKLIEFCEEKQINLVNQSFISFQKIKAEKHEAIQNLFFGSPRAVNYYLENFEEIEDSIRIFCIGKSTADYLRNLNYSVFFEGIEAGNPQKVGEEIQKILNGEILHIALSKQSNHSIIKVLGDTQCKLIYVYETIENTLKLTSTFDYYIFTSPSNASAFLKNNKIENNSKVIAWGKTTESFLKTQNIKVNFTLTYSTEEELINYFLKKVLNKKGQIKI